MSHRYPDEMRCPDCELLVQGSKRRGELRAHRGKALAAGRGDAACAAPRAGTRQAEELEAQAHRAASASRRAAYWSSRDQPTTITGEGTAQLRPGLAPAD